MDRLRAHRDAGRPSRGAAAAALLVLAERLGSAVAAHPAALAAVTPAQVRAWAAPCSPGAALSVLGPAATPLQGTPWQGAVR